jgi:CRISPR-associated endonuclease Csn1
MGANSIGWCAIRLGEDNTPCGLLDMGVRIYPDGRNPKDNSSLAAQRRGPRAMRRNRDRYLQRRNKLLNALTRIGLMPADEAGRQAVARLDPYHLRALALREPLSPYELGRVLFHLNQNRGFRSNRKTDRGSNEGGLISDAVARTQDELARTGRLTYGSWLAQRHSQHNFVRIRLAGSGKAAAYPFYPLRAMIEAELDTIWSTQSAWNPLLTPPMGDNLRGIIFHQRDLRPPIVGRCRLESTEPRAARALPTAQRYRIAQDLAHLRLTRPGLPDQPLSSQQRALLANVLYRGRDLTFDQVRTLLKISSETDFNSHENKLVGCVTASRLGHGKKAAIGDAWHGLDLATQDAAVTALLEAETDEQAIEALRLLGIDIDAASRAAKTLLGDGHGSLSAKAMGRILPHLEAGKRYDEAVKAAGYLHHSDHRTGEIRERLPYYGELLFDRIGTGSGEPSDPDEKRLGRAPNPTVHVALNELRRVVNAIIEHHGPPTQIVVETLRDLGRSKKQREAYRDEQKKNQAANDDRRKMLREMGLRENGRNLMRLRLWQEQATDPKNRICPYTGTVITSRTAVSEDIEEDHVLPFAMTLDDSAANRVLVTRQANRNKARRAPYEAFGHTRDWPDMLERAALLPANKRWRFQPDAMAKFAREEDFLARHLTDSATIARWAKDYLEVLAPGKVWSIPGRLTALLRDKLGLRPDVILGRGGARKDRTDHRHHAIDAVVVALTDPGLLKRTTDAAKRAEETGERLVVKMEPPWEGFVADIASRAVHLIVSHKPDIGWQAALHNDTAYGIIKDASEKEANVVVRRPITDLPDKDGKLRFTVRDPALKAKIEATIASAKDPAGRKAALASLTHSGGHPVRRVRTTERQNATQDIRDRRTGKPYKAVKRDGNHRMELWRLPDGSTHLSVISTFAAAQQAEAERLGKKVSDLRPHPAAKLLMRLHKRDMVRLGGTKEGQLMFVAKISEGQLTLAPHNEGGNLRDRNSSPDDPFKYVYLSSGAALAKAGVQKVFVTPDGRVMPGGRKP